MNEIEEERKFLIKEDKLTFANIETFKKVHIKQGYLVVNENGSVRVRIVKNKSDRSIESFIMSKSKINDTTNFETCNSIELRDAEILLEQFCKQPLITKERYKKEENGDIWEIDFFSSGLKMAEIETKNRKDPNSQLILPDWIGEEVTGKAEYYNANM